MLSVNVYSTSESVFHKLVKCLRLIREYKNGGKYVKQQIADKGRKELEAKMAAIFGENIKGLSTELQEILLDDMVTAFENRLNVLNIAHAKGYC
jgi:tRNA C32,U32 (ribose-2'-O)-methylase TrmJ